MRRRPPRSTRTDTLFPDTTLFRSPGANNVGVAAHIKAASPGGARYDENQTSEERSHADNGIWLCEVHAHLIDHDANEFTVELLQKWKREAEERAFQQLLSGRGPAAVYSAAEELLDELRGLRADRKSTRLNSRH